MVVDAVPSLGLMRETPDYLRVPRRVMRPDVHVEAMQELGVAVAADEEQSCRLFDGPFAGTNPEEYAMSFPVNSVVQ
jgi:hypothetical protein